MRRSAEAGAANEHVPGHAAEAQVAAFGGSEIRLAQEISAQITRAIAEGKLAVVPQVLVGGDGKNANAIEAISAMVLAAGNQFRQRPGASENPRSQ